MHCLRRTNGKWYANKKIYSSAHHGVQTVTLYVGKDEACTRERLWEISERFALPYEEFWCWYYSPSRKGKKKRTKSKECTSSGEDDLQASLDEARKRIYHLEAENQNLSQKLEAQGVQVALALLEQFIDSHGLSEKLKDPNRNRTVAYLAKFRKWLE
jgi:hypothetical protein